MSQTRTIRSDAGLERGVFPDQDSKMILMPMEELTELVDSGYATGQPFPVTARATMRRRGRLPEDEDQSWEDSVRTYEEER